MTYLSRSAVDALEQHASLLRTVSIMSQQKRTRLFGIGILGPLVFRQRHFSELKFADTGVRDDVVSESWYLNENGPTFAAVGEDGPDFSASPLKLKKEMRAMDIFLRTK